MQLIPPGLPATGTQFRSPDRFAPDMRGPSLANARPRWGMMAFALVVLLATGRVRAADDTQPFGMEARSSWTTSRVVGSPEPPLPFAVEKTFTHVPWKSPLYVAPEPDQDAFLVVLQGGERDRPSKILRLRDDASGTQPSPLLEMKGRLIYSVTFHPGYATNGFLFVFSNGPTPNSARTNRISRFLVSRESRGCDLASEKVILEWRSQGHDGGETVFGHDGMLYISAGDGTTDSDTAVTGQDLSDLPGSILRIDLEHPAPGREYSVPADNPFTQLQEARPEIWAYGLRNPWRMTIDRLTGQIWVGVNGQDLWETAHLVRRGENYGWSVYEGNHPFYPNRKRGPTPLVPPTLEHSHAEMRSLTGGVVYYGEQFPELNGAYIYGDYATGLIWAARHDGTRVTWHQQLASTTLQIAGFALDHRGGILIVDHGSGIYRLVRAPLEKAAARFPTRLSDTGLFVSTRDHQPQPGVIPYSVNAPAWADGAQAERFIALPEAIRIEYGANGGWNITNGAVLVQTLSLEMEAGHPASRRRIETRLLTRQNGQWAGYSYRWDNNGRDADLVTAKGAEETFSICDSRAPGGIRQQAWRFPSRIECMVCHSRAANFLLGVSEVQMNREHAYGNVRDNQLRAFAHIGLFDNAPSKPPADLPKLVDPYDASQSLEKRARSYLHVNCSVCHIEAGGGNAKMELGFATALNRMSLIGARPQHDTFGIENAMLISPAEPAKSVLLQRISRRGPGQMPPVVSDRVDDQAVALFQDWIKSLPSRLTFVRDWKMADLLPKLDQLKQNRSLDAGETVFRQNGCAECHRFAGEGGSVGPDLTGISRRLSARDLLESILEPSKVIAEGYAGTEITTKDDELISGFAEREDESTIILRPASGVREPIVIAKKDIRQRALSKTSNMPTGIANSLSESQILDLMAYLLSEH